jgi:hypothetical protein
MILLKLGMLAGFNGAIVPKMNVTYQPVKWAYVSQSLGIALNDKYSDDIAQYNAEVGFLFKEWQLAIGHEASIKRSNKTLAPFNYAEISYKKEF